MNEADLIRNWANEGGDPGLSHKLVQPSPHLGETRKKTPHNPRAEYRARFNKKSLRLIKGQGRRTKMAAWR